MKAMALAKTLVLVSVVLFFALFHGSGTALLGSFVLLAATVVVVPWTIYSIVRIAIRPAERRSRAIRLAIWATALAVSFAARAHWDAEARKEANAVAATILSHKSRTGAYPEGLGELGINAQALKEEFSLTYRVENGKASLFYSQPSMPMVALHYNFETNAWKRLD